MITQWLVGGGIFAIIASPVYHLAFRDEFASGFSFGGGVVMLIAAGISSL